MADAENTPDAPIPGAHVVVTVSKPQMLEQLDSFIYINGTELASNNWDVRIALGERLPNKTSQARVGIVMSHQHFKAFVSAMQTQLEKLEEMMGEIRFTPIKMIEGAEKMD